MKILIFFYTLIQPFPLKLNARAFDRSAEQSDQDGAPTTFPSSRGKVNLNRRANSSDFQFRLTFHTRKLSFNTRKTKEKIRRIEDINTLPLTRGKTSSRWGKDFLKGQ